MAENMREMTREGYDNLNAELEHLVTVVRKENAERLKEAISLGDISENAEYDAAKEAQAETEERISEIEDILRTAHIVEDSGENIDTVMTGRLVTIKDLDSGYEATYEIVGSSGADPLNGKLSNASLVGEHLMGRKIGETIEVTVPDGLARFEILNVELKKKQEDK